MKIEYVKIDKIKEYGGNSKLHPREQIDKIKKSINEFGMNDPIGIWKNEIVEGHGRYIACREMGMDKVPIIRLDHLTDKQRKAYTIIHNKLTMDSGFDLDILENELDELGDEIDLDGFDLVLDDDEDDDDKLNERHRTGDAYNLGLVDKEESTKDFWEMPIIKNDGFIPSDLIGFNYAKTSKDTECGIHFYLDDYQFERIWNSPDDYVDILRQYECVLSPDFSLYMDMPMAMKIWNVYRSRVIGAYYQNMGIKVIPTLSWAEKETYEFCFKGIPKGSIVSISTIGVKNSDESMKIWRDGMDAMIKEIEPSTILVYGGQVDYDYGDIEVIYYENKVTERMVENERNKT